MNKSRFSEQQIVKILQANETGITAADRRIENEMIKEALKKKF